MFCLFKLQVFGKIVFGIYFCLAYHAKGRENAKKYRGTGKLLKALIWRSFKFKKICKCCVGAIVIAHVCWVNVANVLWTRIAYVYDVLIINWEEYIRYAYLLFIVKIFLHQFVRHCYVYVSCHICHTFVICAVYLHFTCMHVVILFLPIS